MAGLMAFDQGYKNFALVSIKEEPFKVEQAANVEKVIRIIIPSIEFYICFYHTIYNFRELFIDLAYTSLLKLSTSQI